MLTVLCDVSHDVINVLRLMDLIDGAIGQCQKRLTSSIERRLDIEQHFD